IEDHCVDVIVSVGSNFFYTVTLPVTLWFLDREKANNGRADQVLFVDARDIYRQIDRAHRDWTPQNIEFLANIVRLWRGEEPDFTFGTDQLLLERFPDKEYLDVAGLCAVATIADIKEQDWSLNAGRYVGIRESHASDADFIAQIAILQEQFSELSAEAATLSEAVEATIDEVLRA